MISEDTTKVVGVPWDIFLRWLNDVWEPGQHIAVCGPTGEGKTTFVVPMLNLRSWVIALDPKGEDDTLAASGFQRITKLPLSGKMRNAIADGEPLRLIVGGSARNHREDKALRDLMKSALDMVRHQGGWTLYADEFQILTDLRMFGLGIDVERLLIAARRARTSVITSFQAPAWVSTAATRQARIVVILRTRNIQMVKNVAEAMGRPWRDLWDAVRVLPEWHMLVIPSDIGAPMLLVNPPKIN